MSTPHPRLQAQEPERNEPCLCGSGNKFKRCCFGRYSRELKHQALYNAGKFDEALVALRQYLTWYRLCHKAHTMPFLRSGTPESLELLTIDINALSAMLEDLHLCYYHSGRSQEFPDVLLRLAGAVSDKRWSEKIIYFNALWHLVDDEDPVEAGQVLAQIKISECSDSKVLTLYLEVSGHSIGFQEQLSLLDRIVESSEVPSYKLQYTTLKGVQYCLVCKIPEGCEIVERGIRLYKSRTGEEQSLYGRIQLFRSLHFLGNFKVDKQPMEEALKLGQALLETLHKGGYSPVQQGEIGHLVGDCLLVLGHYDKASEAYSASMEVSGSQVPKIFLVRAYLKLGRVDDAVKLLEEIDDALFSEANRLDFVISLAMVASETQDNKHLDRAKDALHSVEGGEPIFARQRDAWLIELLQIQPKSEPGALRRFLKLLNKYVTLNPNIAGIGIDLNRIIEDFDERKK